jgi:hypothetical protein
MWEWTEKEYESEGADTVTIEFFDGYTVRSRMEDDTIITVYEV